MLTKFLEKNFPDSKITKVWSNKRIRAFILLPFWIAFIVILFIFFVIPYEKEVKNNAGNEVQEEKEFNTNVDDLWQNLMNFEYDFEYRILKDDPITYKGSINNNIITGSKDDGVNITNFKIDENNNVYTIDGENETLYGSSENVLGTYYLKVSNIYKEITNVSYTKEDNQYFYEKDDLYVIIDTDKDVINSISVSVNGEKYLLNFYNFR